PILIWLGAAALAGGLAGERIWAPGPFVAALLLAGIGGGFARRSAKRRKGGEVALRARVDGLAQAEATYATRAATTPAIAEVRELSREDLAAARYAFDRALQPIDDFNGYDIRDIFQTASVRYQINYAGYILAQM